MEAIAEETSHVAGRTSGMGDPSPFTARGVLRAMEAVAEVVWGDTDLGGRRVALQGLGHVGTHLAALLHERGARLLVSDVVSSRVARAVMQWNAEPVSVGAILEVEADVLAPCALGGVIDLPVADRLRAPVVCGAANNQLAGPNSGDRLHERGIAYVPDYVANAGGVISGAVDIAKWDRPRMERTLDGIADTVRAVFAKAGHEAIPTWRAADLLAEERLREEPS
jgi:leucine dehydrogenase